MKEIMVFLSEELEAVIDRIAELQSRSSEIEVSIRTLSTLTSNYNKSKDDTRDVFLGASVDKSYEAEQIDNMNNSITVLNIEREDINKKIADLNNRFTRIKGLLDNYCNTASSIDAEFINSLIQDLIRIKTNEIQYASFAAVDPTRVMLESAQNIDYIDAVINRLSKVSEDVSRET